MLRTYFQETFYDMPIDIAQKYAEVIRDAILNGAAFDGEKREGFLLSQKRGYNEPLYIEDVHQTEEGVAYGDDPIDADDEIINVIIIDGPVTRDGDGCSYGSKEHRDQILYANTIPQVKGHLFIINTPGGAASARIDYEQAIADCREKGKPTVAWVDGDCCSAGQLVAALCDRTVVMNGRDSMGCIGTMCAFWGVANGTVDSDGHRYIELVSVTSPDKNAEYREACDGKTEKLQAELDKLGEEFRETVRQNRPLVKEEHLTGKVFNADDVMGALVDEIGDQDRAIACIYELADGTLTPARYAATAEKPAGEAAGTVEQPQNTNNDMKEDEIKAAEAAAAEAATQEAPAEETTQEAAGEAADTVEQPADETEQPAEEPADKTDQPAEEPADKAEVPVTEPADTVETAGTTVADLAEEVVAATEAGIDRISNAIKEAQAMFENERQAHLLLQGEMEKLKADYQEKSDTLAKVANDFNEQSAALVSAQALLAERDKTIETLNGDMEVLRSDIATKDASIAEMQATIDKLTSEAAAKDKVIAEKESEIKELAGKTTPLASGAAGVPADNGTGAPAQETSPIKLGMSYEEIRAREKNKKKR